MEKKMETTIVYWGYIGIIEYRNNGKENGNYCSILGLYACYGLPSFQGLAPEPLPSVGGTEFSRSPNFSGKASPCPV